jgi:hypothetical protein
LLLSEDVSELKLEAGEQRRRQSVAAFTIEFDRASEALALSPIDADHIQICIHDPVL